MTNPTRCSPSRLTGLALLAALVVLFTPAPAAAADTTPAVFASMLGGYWQGFMEFWGGMLKKQNGIVMVDLGVGAVSLFIITRGKWRK